MSIMEQQRKVYDVGYLVYCEVIFFGFNKRDFDGSDGKFLLLELFVLLFRYSSGIEFVVNFLEFMSENGYFCCIFFWNFLLKIIVVKDFRFG